MLKILEYALKMRKLNVVIKKTVKCGLLGSLMSTGQMFDTFYTVSNFTEWGSL